MANLHPAATIARIDGRWPSLLPSCANDVCGLHRRLTTHTTTRRGTLAASYYIQQRHPALHVSGQINGLHHTASTTARSASDRNLYQGVLQTMALHVAHDMSYRS